MEEKYAATSGRSVVFAFDDILPNQIIKNLHFCVKKETVKNLFHRRNPFS
jgi:hypothetical protein